MPAELHPFAEVVDLDRGGPDPPFDYPDYVGTRLWAPKDEGRLPVDATGGA